MRKRTLCLATWLLATGTYSGAVAEESTSKPAKVSRPFEYAGYTSPTLTGSKRSAEYVPMSDGEKLAVDIFMPSGGSAPRAFPVILQYTPYQRSTIDPKTGKTGSFSKTLINQFFLSYGYALVYADMRGTGASTIP